jgi:hypothetical protein
MDALAVANIYVRKVLTVEGAVVAVRRLWCFVVQQHLLGLLLARKLDVHEEAEPLEELNQQRHVLHSVSTRAKELAIFTTSSR